MKVINTRETLEIPAGVEVTVKARVVTVKGKRGQLTKSFKHLPVDVYVKDGAVHVDKWFGERLQIAAVRTVKSHIANLITGVTRGYRYYLKYVYAHFPINVSISEKDTLVEIRNFIGQKVVFTIPMHEGCVCKRSGEKDEIYVEGNDIEKVSLSAARIQQSTTVKNKDIRKFLDGIYVSKKTFIEEED